MLHTSSSDPKFNGRVLGIHEVFEDIDAAAHGLGISFLLDLVEKGVVSQLSVIAEALYPRLLRLRFRRRSDYLTRLRVSFGRCRDAAHAGRF